MLHTGAFRSIPINFLPFVLFSLAVLGAVGCGANQASGPSPTGASTTQTFEGTVYGGQQPIVGAAIQLYAAGSPSSGGGYGQGATPLITGTLPVTSSSGSFTITGRYTVPTTPSFFYIVATGGRPGSVNPANPNIVLMAAISGCTATSTLSSSLFININEVTTAAAVMELQPFIAAPSGVAGANVLVGAPAANYNDLRTAFENVSNLVNLSTGTVVSPTGSKGQLLNTLADVLAACVNSDPASSNNCSNLFTDATPSGTTAADTVQAAWYIAQNPARNVPALFGLVPPSPPFVALSSAPASFAVSSPTDLVACFAVLGGSTVTNTGSTIISGGDLGLYPGSSVTGFPPGTVTSPATQYVSDSVAQNAQDSLTSAYSHVAGLTGTGSLPADMSTSTFTPGVYSNAGAVGLSAGTVTLDAQGDSDAVFVFQIGSTLTTASGTQVVLIHNAQANNVFWQVGTSATLGAGSTFEGTILAHASITLESGATLQGRALANTAAVTLNGNTVTAP
jgi:hypothetical protein